MRVGNGETTFQLELCVRIKQDYEDRMLYLRIYVPGQVIVCDAKPSVAALIALHIREQVQSSTPYPVTIDGVPAALTLLVAQVAGVALADDPFTDSAVTSHA